MLFADREKKPDLRADAGHASLEITELCPGTAVAGELLKEIAGKPDLDILAHELRCGPVDMKAPRVARWSGHKSGTEHGGQP